jgi:hypothetical protein
MPLRPCLQCGTLTTGSYCPRHQPVRSTPGRSARPQQRFRAQVIAAAGGQCQWVEDGKRCPETEQLHAHHLTPFRQAPNYDVRASVALCLHHHRLAEERLRDTRPAA